MCRRSDIRVNCISYNCTVWFSPTINEGHIFTYGPVSTGEWFEVECATWATISSFTTIKGKK